MSGVSARVVVAREVVSAFLLLRVTDVSVRSVREGEREECDDDDKAVRPSVLSLSLSLSLQHEKTSPLRLHEYAN